MSRENILNLSNYIWYKRKTAEKRKVNYIKNTSSYTEL